MITECHNVACRLIMKAISKSSLAGCLVHMNACSIDYLAQQNLHIPEHADNRTLLSWLFNARFCQRQALTSIRPDVILITPYYYPLNPSHLPLPTFNRCSMLDPIGNYTKLTS